MGWNDHMDDLEGPARVAAFKAGAISSCPIHEDIIIDQEDPDAVAKAYAIGTNMWKAGDVDCDREDFMDAIKSVIDDAGEECGICSKNMDD